MPTHDVNSWTTMLSLDPFDSDDIINLTGSFSTTNNTVALLGGATLNGNGYTITFHSGRNRGLFQVDGAQINDLIVDGDGQTIADDEGMVIAYTTTTQYGTLIDCRVHNATLGDSTGGFASGYALRDSSETTSFVRCHAYDLDLNARFGGGFVGRNGTNISITDSVANVDLNSTEGGSFLAYGVAGTNTITGSYALVTNIASGACGGLASRIGGGSLTVDQCFVLISGSVTAGYSGGLVGGMASTVGNGVTITVNDSYVVGTIGGTNSGALVGYHAYGGTSGSENVIYLNRCYHVGSLTGRSVVGWHSSSDSYRRVEVTDCVVQGTNDNTSSTELTYVRTDTSLEGIDQDLPDGDDDGQSNLGGGFADNWSSDVWLASSDSGAPYPMLKTFQDLLVWDGSYTAYNLSSGVVFGGKMVQGYVVPTFVRTPNGDVPIGNVQVNDQLVLQSGRQATVKEMNSVFEPKFPTGCVMFQDPNGNLSPLSENDQLNVMGAMYSVKDLIRPYYSIKY